MDNYSISKEPTAEDIETALRVIHYFEVKDRDANLRMASSAISGKLRTALHVPCRLDAQEPFITKAEE